MLNIMRGDGDLKRAVALTVVMCIFLLTFSACGSGKLIRSAESLLGPPLYYDEYEELVEVFRKQAGFEASLCNPYSGNYRSAIIVEDIDGDYSDEALVFYKTASSADNGTSEVRINYLDYKNDEWVSVGDAAGHGDGIESVSITDMDGDGYRELIIVWNTSGVTSNFLVSVYRSKITEPMFSEIFIENCMAYFVFDIDDDSYDDLFYVTQSVNSDIPQQLARVIGVSGDSLVFHGEAKLDPNVSRYTLTVPEKRSDEGTFSLYLDALKGEQNMITEYLYWDKMDSILINPYINPETMTTTKTLRFEPIASNDINNDGKIDIPSQSLLTVLPGDEFGNIVFDGSEVGETVYLTTWSNFKKSESYPVAYTLINSKDGYMINLTKEETETLEVVSYREDNRWVVYGKDSATGESVELYSVVRIEDGAENAPINENYIPVLQNDGSTVYVFITQQGYDSGIDEQTIKQKITKYPS